MDCKTQEMEDSPDIRRPLDIGYEFLPEGVSAFDFIEYELIPLPKPKLYHQNELPPHELLGENVIIRRELLEEEPIEHSELWLKIVSKMNPELLPKHNEPKIEENKFLECHLVDQPTTAKLLPTLMPRSVVEDNPVTGLEEDDEKEVSIIEKTLKKLPTIDFDRFDKLNETINWLKYCAEDEIVDDSESE